jgi:hypothetical protein
MQPAKNTNGATRARSSTARRAPSARAAASLDRAANNRRRSHQQPAVTSADRSSLGNVPEAGAQHTPVQSCRGPGACAAKSPLFHTGRVHVQVGRAAAVVNQEKVAKEVRACPPRFCRTRRVTLHPPQAIARDRGTDTPRRLPGCPLLPFLRVQSAEREATTTNAASRAASLAAAAAAQAPP